VIRTVTFLTLALVSGFSATVANAALEKVVHHYVFYGRDRERISEPNFLRTAKFEGAQLMYAWRELEREEGRYDFSEIQKDLTFLRSKGKKLFVQLQDTTFDPARIAVPNYLLTPKFHGGVVYQYNDEGKPEGRVLMRWDPMVRGRLHKLIEALGKEFDGKIEGIALQETAIGVTERGPTAQPGFSYVGYRDAILLNMKALRHALRKSLPMQYANFMPGEWLPENDQSYLRSVFECGEQSGVALGAPDLMPKRPAQLNHAYKFMHETKATVGIAVQDGNYVGSTGDDVKPTGPWPNLVPDLFAFARDYLNARYIFWGAQEPYFSHDVVPYLK
jgi:hypothetical protein